MTNAAPKATKAARHTIVTHGKLAVREFRLNAARDRRQGLQVLSFEQLAVRLAGGLTQPIDDASLRAAIQAVLPGTELGELDGIKDLPGIVAASADTLQKAWRAGLDLAARAAVHPRLSSLARLESTVLAQLPTMMRPADIVALARQRLAHAAAILGPVEIVGLTELSRCWRPLLLDLAKHTPVQWTAGPRPVPAWLAGTGVAVETSAARTPGVSTISAATAYNEAVEALRWARALLASGRARPQDIAIAAASPADYDDHFLSLRADANLDLHFVHGVKVTATRDGQAAAALTDIVVRGLSQARVRRLAILCGRDHSPFATLPDGWTRILSADASLTSLDAWTRLLQRFKPQDWPDGEDHSQTLCDIVSLLARGTDATDEIGKVFLKGRALTIWRKALLAGPPASIDTTLESLKLDDGLEACVSIAWMPASALAVSPRRFVRLVGLNSSRWPRPITEDRLIPDHIVPTPELDPLPISAADRRDFDTIMRTTTDEVVLSRARRDSEGRLLGRSALLPDHSDETYVRRNVTPLHAFSETDRLTARPREFALEPQAISAASCWSDWHRPGITAHDGLVRPDHPLLLAVLERTQSASSLRRLLRNPLGFVWTYALRWQSPDSGSDPLVLESVDMGNLVHMVLDLALRTLETADGIANASESRIVAAVGEAAGSVAADWENTRSVPPAVIWRKTLEEARHLAARGLLHASGACVPGTRAYGEVPFGGASPKSDAALPWDAAAVVEIPGTGFRIAGYIDRLDITRDGKSALVRDYKTGKPVKEGVCLGGGSELQRCLYAFAVKALLGKDVAIGASLLFLHDEIDRRLDNPEAALTEVTGHLRAARASLANGAALIGPDSGNDFDDLAFALPAGAAAIYCKRKLPAATERLGEAATIWETE